MSGDAPGGEAPGGEGKTCPGCGGLGWIPAGDEQIGCVRCNGTGEAPAPQPRPAQDAVREAAERLMAWDDWHEDDGPVLWYAVPVEEPPYCGDPLSSDWPTEWTAPRDTATGAFTGGPYTGKVLKWQRLPGLPPEAAFDAAPKQEARPEAQAELDRIDALLARRITLDGLNRYDAILLALRVAEKTDPKGEVAASLRAARGGGE